MSVKSVQRGSLIISVECPTLESLERLWNDCETGCLSDIAESCLVTDELKTKLGLDHVRLKITIERENYLICEKALMKIAGELASLYRALLGNIYFGLKCTLRQFACIYISVNYFKANLMNSRWVKFFVTTFYSCPSCFIEN